MSLTNRCFAGGIPLLLAGLLVGCVSIPEPLERDALAERLAAGAALSAVVLNPESSLPIRGYVRTPARHVPIAVYIEGDGYAWLNRYTPSPDPTPVNPVALRLAAIDSSANVIYLARPGQYLHGAVAQRYWLSDRFADDVIEAYVGLVKEFASSLDATTVELVGYSGGGAIAALVAARLKRELPTRLVHLRTVGGNLDIEAWARLRRISPLEGSRNPADEAATLQDVPQIHVTGKRDTQVPPGVLHAYVLRLGSSRCLREVQADVAHAGPWEEVWRQVLLVQPACSEPR